MREKDIQTRTKVNNRPVCMYNVHQNVDFINTNLKLIGILWGFWHLKVVGRSLVVDKFYWRLVANESNMT